jgi:hypothetical protein
MADHPKRLENADLLQKLQILHVYLLSLLVLPFSVSISCLRHSQRLILPQLSSVATCKTLYSQHTRVAIELQQEDGMV